MRLALLALVVPLAGCGVFMNKNATAQLQLGYDVAQQRAAIAESRVAELTERIERMEAMLRDQGIDGTSAGANLSSVGSELSALRGTVEELQFEVKQTHTDVTQFQVDQERRQLHAEARLAQIEGLLAVSPPPPPRLDAGGGSASPGGSSVAVDPTPTPTPPAEELPSDPASRLALAEERMAQGSQAAARVILEQTMTTMKSTDPLMPEMQYRVAETWFNDGRYKEAARAFQVVTDRFEKSSWAPWAMLRIGECFAALNRPDNARVFYEGVTTKYPGTDAALEARDKLRQ